MQVKRTQKYLKSGNVSPDSWKAYSKIISTNSSGPWIQNWHFVDTFLGRVFDQTGLIIWICDLVFKFCDAVFFPKGLCIWISQARRNPFMSNICNSKGAKPFLWSVLTFQIKSRMRISLFGSFRKSKFRSCFSWPFLYFQMHYQY